MIHAKEITSSANKKAQEYLAGWQRARAELDNYRKRIQSEQDIADQKRLIRLLEPFLQLKDNFNAVAAHLPQELENNAWAQGVLHISRQLDDILLQYDVRVVGKTGEEFDPAKHEAVEQIKKKNMSEGKVVAVVRAGYAIGDQIIRPAQVKVSV
ncbi:MAG: nucleotide exchange factor GrpE [bacterium]|nr:nucleotide exchange factor GrpE [bacterium]MDZ4345814.1 nucleotide exchange factor GrpE [Candidatus Binatia bacterium]